MLIMSSRRDRCDFGFFRAFDCLIRRGRGLAEDRRLRISLSSSDRSSTLSRDRMTLLPALASKGEAREVDGWSSSSMSSSSSPSLSSCSEGSSSSIESPSSYFLPLLPLPLPSMTLSSSSASLTSSASRFLPLVAVLCDAVVFSHVISDPPSSSSSSSSCP